MSNGDRAYVRGPQGSPLEMTPGCRASTACSGNALPLKDPNTGEVLGYEALVCRPRRAGARRVAGQSAGTRARCAPTSCPPRSICRA